MTRTVKTVALALAIGVLGGCAAPAAGPQPQAPQWITQPPHQAGMAYGVGSAELHGTAAAALQRASEQARLELIKQLQVRISGEFSSTTRVQRDGAGDNTFAQQIEDVVRSSVPTADLPGIRIQQTFVDEQQGVVYALAQLDRQQAALTLGQRLNELDLELDGYQQRPLSGSRLAQAQALLPALKLLREREQLGEQLALVSLPGSAGYIRLTPQQQALKQRIYQRLGELTVQVETASASAEALQSPLLQALTEMGLRIGGPEPADLTLVLGLDSATRYRDGVYYVFTDSRVTVHDERSRILRQLQAQTKAASGSEALAQRKAAQQTAEQLGKALAQALFEGP